ncbi:TPA: hypothetical protein L9W62_000056 [Klebsiella pneumoniae]|nr:hypothetical protein [Klebsiella pneumoniae]
MAHNPNFKPVLLTAEQMAIIKLIQEEERKKSPLSVAPTLNAIVRGLVDKALSNLSGAA